MTEILNPDRAMEFLSGCNQAGTTDSKLETLRVVCAHKLETEDPSWQPVVCEIDSILTDRKRSTFTVIYGRITVGRVTDFTWACNNLLALANLENFCLLLPLASQWNLTRAIEVLALRDSDECFRISKMCKRLADCTYVMMHISRALVDGYKNPKQLPNFECLLDHGLRHAIRAKNSMLMLHAARRPNCMPLLKLFLINGGRFSSPSERSSDVFSAIKKARQPVPTPFRNRCSELVWIAQHCTEKDLVTAIRNGHRTDSDTMNSFDSNLTSVFGEGPHSAASHFRLLRMAQAPFFWTPQKHFLLDDERRKLVYEVTMAIRVLSKRRRLVSLPDSVLSLVFRFIL